MDGQPGDKSPDYYRASLRDEVKTGSQMSKLQRHEVPGSGAEKPPSRRDGRTYKFGFWYDSEILQGIV
jgi:hypothetical protein